jgi:hypothetical protein
MGVDVAKHFFFDTDAAAKKAGEFFPDKFFHAVIIFASKVGSLPSE